MRRELSHGPVLDHFFRDATISVLDTETTGLFAGADRLVEICIVRVPPDGKPEVVLDTLLNPQRAVAATEIHGIRDDDVADAPTFAEIAGDVAKALSGTVLAAYNVYFDVRFVQDEFSRVGFRYVVPHFCLMYLRPLLGLGKRCSLTDACRAHGIDHSECHTAASDALAGASLWARYRSRLSELGLQTFRELSSRKVYKFMSSFAEPPLSEDIVAPLRACGRCKPRPRPTVSDVPSRADQLHEYMDAVNAAVADLEITQDEVAYLQTKRAQLKLAVEELRAVHGRVFAAVLGEALADSWISNEEWLRVRALHDCLRQLGWAPGM